MLALTIQQPYASLIVAGIKVVECRTWRPPEGPEDGMLKFAVHAASKKVDLRKLPEACVQWMEENQFDHSNLPTGAIIGAVNVIRHQHYLEARDLLPKDIALGWWDDRTICWYLANAVKFESIIPSSGQLGVWRPNPTVEAAIRKIIPHGW